MQAPARAPPDDRMRKRRRRQQDSPVALPWFLAISMPLSDAVMAKAVRQREKRRLAEARRKSKKRMRIAERDRVCVYCGRIPDGSTAGLEPTLDHVIPKSLGGKSNEANLVLSCFECNQRKADRLPSQLDDEARRRIEGRRASA